MRPALPPRRVFNYDPPQDELEILHVDNELIFLGKPSGLLSVPGKGEDKADCVLLRLRAQYPEALLVHRLDVATSGVMIFARTPHAQRHLGLQFERRHTKKVYMAVVAGHVSGDSGYVNLPLRADWPERPRQRVCFEHGKASQTHWVKEQQDGLYTQMILHPVTGRSHQLRVHMWAIGHPILGDRIYAADDVFRASPRLCLHAYSLSVRHPNGGKPVTVSASCPFFL